MNLESVVFAILAGVALVGGIVTVFARDVTRMVIGLAAFLLSIAGFFVYWKASFLGVVQLFVYVGGVLVLFVFAIMLVHRSTEGSPHLETRHDIASLTVAGGLFIMVVTALRDFVHDPIAMAIETGTDEVAAVLLGPMLTHFEMVGVMLLAVLVAVVIIVGGEER